jgi:hypothetical protein
VTMDRSVIYTSQFVKYKSRTAVAGSDGSGSKWVQARLSQDAPARRPNWRVALSNDPRTTEPPGRATRKQRGLEAHGEWMGDPDEVIH